MLSRVATRKKPRQLNPLITILEQLLTRCGSKSTTESSRVHRAVENPRPARSDRQVMNVEAVRFESKPLRDTARTSTPRLGFTLVSTRNSRPAFVDATLLTNRTGKTLNCMTSKLFTLVLISATTRLKTPSMSVTRLPAKFRLTQKMPVTMFTIALDT